MQSQFLKHVVRTNISRLESLCQSLLIMYAELSGGYLDGTVAFVGESGETQVRIGILSDSNTLLSLVMEALSPTATIFPPQRHARERLFLNPFQANTIDGTLKVLNWYELQEYAY